MSKVARDFFYETQEGVDLLKSLQTERRSNHEKAEQNPELARDFVQRAKGIAEAINMIKSACTDSKKPGREKEEASE